MGIDVYLRWEGQTDVEREAQITGFSIMHGHVGYLREAYHGEPYATQVLMPEGFDENCPRAGVHIPAATLRARLPATLDAVRKRARFVYNEARPFPGTLKAFRDFVALAERLEAEGRKPRIIVSY